ncbi:hypothetical protein CC1G_14895 [Coprinopsis cinerea okayama7|uniref:Uncharacterized protein n=1 Tax=Coprinopsis cinerea (strain Okayama-7 / 130 / ATCC MYA-4618 / FGSC 9003) TaxID=240176 RepID=D6RNK8_COPC7|nr:hypothetical protein CC1G_14895 [Coprinopsis cinerea okayama7\|eukprot:XP_002910918.1 hypothetical protein CC1G_14895 [Coprinopsis cinerea okayama7\
MGGVSCRSSHLQCRLRRPALPFPGRPPSSDYTSITLQLGRSLERCASIVHRNQNGTPNLEQAIEEYNVINDAIAGDCLAYAAIQNKYETLGYPQVGVAMDGLLDLLIDSADMRVRILALEALNLYR